MQPKSVTTDLKVSTEHHILKIVGADSKEILRFEQNGDIYVKGNLVENDREVVNGFRELLATMKANNN